MTPSDDEKTKTKKKIKTKNFRELILVWAVCT